jgi:hypothetical protein
MEKGTQLMSDVKRWTALYEPLGSLAGAEVATMVLASDHDAFALRLDAELKAELKAVIQDCRILCNALQRIEAGEAEPRMIARRTLEHWSEKAALANAERE